MKRYLHFCFGILILVSQMAAAQTLTSEIVAGGFQFVEGPLWSDSLGLLFSDINANTIYRWTPSAGSSVYLKPSGKSNGLAWDAQGRLLMALQGDRKVVRQERDGALTILAERYTGKKLNSPNDLAVKADGAIFFTDPPYGISTPQQELGYCGIFRISPGGVLQLLDKSLSRPNGIAFSPDEKLLYVADAEIRRIYVWDVIGDSLLGNKRLFASMTPNGYADGMKVDASGNLFATGPGGIWIYAPDGVLLQKISVPGQTTNCGWGDADRQTLYITSGGTVYKVRSPFVKVEGSDQSAVPDRFQLLPNYPNPFNASTAIRFYIPAAGKVRLQIYDMLGRAVRTLMDTPCQAGWHTAVWDGCSVSGVPVSSDLYFYRLITDRFTCVRKALLLR